MAKWIYIAVLLYVVAAVHCCKDGQKIKVKDECGTLVCMNNKWHTTCMLANSNDKENNTVEACLEGKSYKDFFEPGTYYECKDGTLVFKRCPYGLHFDNEKKICHTPPEIEPNIKMESEVETNLTRDCDEDTKYADVFDKNIYYNCKDGMLDPKTCDGDSVFDSEKQRCVSQQLKTSNENSFITGKSQCTEGEARRKEGSCKEYYECKNGIEVLSKCMECQNYDENKKKCRYVFDSPCTSDSPGTETGTTSSPEDLTTELTTTWTSPSEVTEFIDTSTRITIEGGSTTDTTEDDKEVSTKAPVTEPSTPEEHTTAVPFGDCKDRRALPDCKYYLECHEGELVTRRCGWLQYFDSMTKSCSFMGYKCHESK